MLTEREISACLRESLRQAAAECDMIARFPSSGPAYTRLRQCLKLAEGCCRQMGHWREDGRWFMPGVYLEQVHQKARDWLHRPSVESKRLFTKLAEVCRKWEKELLRLEVGATLRRGPILPKQQAALRENRAVQVPAGFHETASGLVVPAA